MCGEEECVMMLFLYAFYIQTVENNFVSASSEIMSCSYCVSFIVPWLVFPSDGNFCLVHIDEDVCYNIVASLSWYF